ncbi:MAG: hypothetical protein ABFD81_00095 [Syntrophaceae bacterium]
MAEQGSVYPIKIVRGEDLSRNQSFMICARSENSSPVKTTVFTPDKVRSDLVGRTVGPVAEVKVKTGAAFGDGSGSSTEVSSAHVYVPIPMDMVFDQTNITNLKILEVKTSGNSAALVVQVETISNYAGKLRLRYESVAGEWILRELENLSFKAQ